MLFCGALSDEHQALVLGDRSSLGDSPPPGNNTPERRQSCVNRSRGKFPTGPHDIKKGRERIAGQITAAADRVRA
jgi:hypothetical protein